MANLDWSSVGKTQQKSESKGSSVLFLTQKNCPVTLVPDTGSGIVEYQEVYDQDLRKSRRPDEGEQGRTKYAFKALVKNTSGESTSWDTKMVVAGPQIVKQFDTAIKTTQNIGGSDKIPALEITTKGTGREVEYVVDTLKAIGTDSLDKFRDDLDKLKVAEFVDNLLDG